MTRNPESPIKACRNHDTESASATNLERPIVEHHDIPPPTVRSGTVGGGTAETKTPIAGRSWLAARDLESVPNSRHPAQCRRPPRSRPFAGPPAAYRPKI